MIEGVSQPAVSEMPFSRIRRRRPHLTSTQTNLVEVEGTTYLCFPDDHSCFQGTINTDDDESSYTLYGQKIPNQSEQPQATQPSSPNNNNNNNNKEPLESSGSDFYRVTLTDHFTGLSYHLPPIGVAQGWAQKSSLSESPNDNNLFRCKDAEVKFKVENIFKGQKADMVIQRCVGASALLGKGCLVYSGPISISFNEVQETGRTWCL